MGKIDCNVTENYLKEKTRMTTGKGYEYSCSIVCDDCPLYSSNNGKNTDCEVLEASFPTEAIAIVQKWSDEHPENPPKTILDDFLEKHPNAPLSAEGRPHACPCNLGYGTGCDGIDCYACWNRPLEEVRK